VTPANLIGLILAIVLGLLVLVALVFPERF